MSCLVEDIFHLTAFYVAQAQLLRWFLQHEENGVTIRNKINNLNGFQATKLKFSGFIPVIWLT